MSDQYLDMPITAMCILADKLNCPPKYIAIDKGYDTKTDTDLWKDGLFGKKTNRFICFTKEFPIENTCNVVEDLRLFNERDNVPHGYIALDKTADTGEKAFQRKVLHVKMALRYYTDIAVSDIAILVKTKRAPIGYNLVGEVNNHTICVRYSKIPKQQKSVQPNITARINAGSSAPIVNDLPTDSKSNDVNDVCCPMPSPYHRQSSDFYKTIHRIYDSALNYNPLNGVQFEINPIFAKKSKDEYFDTDLIDKYAKLTDILTRYEYDFSLERMCIES